MGRNADHPRRTLSTLAAVGLLGGTMLVTVAVRAQAATPRTTTAPACTDSWNGSAGDGLWLDAGNWSAKAVPGTGDVACIGNVLTGSYTVTISGGDAYAGTLLLGGAKGTQTLQVDNNDVHLWLASASTIKANGVLKLGDATDSGYASLVDYNSAGAVLTNDGTLKSVNPAGLAYLEANVVNDGTVDLGAASTIEDAYAGAVTVTNQGTFEVGSASTYTVDSGSGFANLSGSLAVSGSMTEEGGTFVERAGTESGDPVGLQGLTFDDDTTAGSGSWTFSGGDSTLTGTGSSPGVASGQTLTVDNDNIHLDLPVDVTNDGTVILGDATDTGYASLVQTGADSAAVTLTNNGAIYSENPSGYSYIEANVANSTSGSIVLSATDTIADAYAGPIDVTNDGTLAVGVGSTLSISGGDGLDLQAGGTLSLGNNVNTGESSVITGGDNTLGGRLGVLTTGSPEAGSTFSPITNASDTGSFSSLYFGPYAYEVNYSPSAVTLESVKAFSVTTKKVTAHECLPFTATVAIVTNGSQTGATYSAVINWGDFTSSAGKISASGKVTASHQYKSPGKYSVQVTVSDNLGTTEILTTTATVTVPPKPSVTTVSPDSVTAGQSATLTVTGTVFTTNAKVGFSNSGVSVTSVSRKSPTKLVVKVKVAKTATVGTGNVTVTTPGGTGTCTGCLTVIASGTQSAAGSAPAGHVTTGRVPEAT